MEIGKGFLQLQEDSSRRSSLHPQSAISFAGSSAYTTRLGCCGCCSIKIEKEEGNFRVGKLSLAPYCHLALLVFGCCFLLAGTVLTGLAYNPTQNSLVQPRSEDPTQERVAGPLFLVVGVSLLIMGIGLAILGCKLERAAARQRSALSRFSFDTRSADIFANLDDIQSQSGDSHRRHSFFGSSFNPTRRSTLSTIAQAVPVGFFMTDSPRTPKTPPIVMSNTVTTQLNSKGESGEVFQDIELGSPGRDDEFSLPALSLRPSIPIPMFISPSLLNATMSMEEYVPPFASRSDEPFGSIVSLGAGHADIASFPAPRVKSQESNSSKSQISHHFDASSSSSSTHQDHLPPIRVDETGNALTAQSKNKPSSSQQHPNPRIKPLLRATKSVDEGTESENKNGALLSTYGNEVQKRPQSGS